MRMRCTAWSFLGAGSASLIAVSTALSLSPIAEHTPATTDVPLSAAHFGVRLEFREVLRPLPELPINLDKPSVKPSPALDRLRIPAELPGADAPPLQLPRFDPERPEAYEEAFRKLYPPLPPLGDNSQAPLGPTGRPVTLAELQRTALARPSGATSPELVARVRNAYFGVLAGQETMRLTHALTRFADDAYEAQVEQVKAGHAALNEPVQLRVIAFQCRAQLVEARNSYVAAWKQLALAIDQPEVAPVRLAGTIAQPLPVLQYDALVALAVEHHAESRAAAAQVARAESALRQADTGRSTFRLVPRSQDDIAVSATELAHARAHAANVATAIRARVIEAFERYDTQRRLVAYYRDHILPDQVRAVRALYARRSQDFERVDFAELLSSPQALTTATAVYVRTLRDAWNAVADLAALAGADDPFALATSARPAGAASIAPDGTLVDALPWPEVMPRPQQARATVPAAPTAHSVSASPAPRVESNPEPVAILPASAGSLLVSSPSEARPVTESIFAVPFVVPEKSTKRRRFFAWPLRRTEIEPPRMLPQIEDLCPCCPSSQAAPALPQTTSPPDELPDPDRGSRPSEPQRRPERMPRGSEPANRDATAEVPLPQIIDGPVPRVETSPVPSISNGVVPAGHWQTNADAPSPVPTISTGPMPAATTSLPEAPAVRVPPLRIRAD